MFAVIISKNGHDEEHKHTQRKIALRQFESYRERAEVDMISVVHSTRRIDEVIAYWERS